MEKFNNKYRISSHRKPNWDYSANAIYFLTIVTKNRECNLGTIENNAMILSDFGKIVEHEWFESFEIRKELTLHDFVLMPNHLHTVVEIFNEHHDDGNRNDAQRIDGNGDDGTAVETHGRVSLQRQRQRQRPPQQRPPIELNDDDGMLHIKRNPPVRLPKSISSFIGGFKSAVNTKIDDFIDEQNLPISKYNRNNHFFQPNYHDHILRNHYEYQKNSNYIANNPSNWLKDKFYV